MQSVGGLGSDIISRQGFSSDDHIFIKATCPGQVTCKIKSVNNTWTCMQEVFNVVQAIATSACEMGKHQFRQAILSGDSCCF